MSEEEAWGEIDFGDAGVGEGVLIGSYLYQWVPGSVSSGFTTSDGVEKSYQSFSMSPTGGISSLVTRQTAFEVSGGTTGNVSDLLSILGGSDVGLGSPSPIQTPDADGEDPKGVPWDSPGFLKGGGMVFFWLLVFLVATRKKK